MKKKKWRGNKKKDKCNSNTRVSNYQLSVAINAWKAHRRNSKNHLVTDLFSIREAAK